MGDGWCFGGACIVGTPESDGRAGAVWFSLLGSSLAWGIQTDGALWHIYDGGSRAGRGADSGNRNVAVCRHLLLVTLSFRQAPLAVVGGSRDGSFFRLNAAIMAKQLLSI